MFQKGDYIIYRNTCVCRVEETNVSFPKSKKSGKSYYKLAPVYETGIIYIPMDTTIFMRSIISKEQAMALISKIPQIKEDGTTYQDHRMLSEHYRSFMNSHECEDLVQLIKTTYREDKASKDTGKKPGAINTQFRKQAETLLHSELAIALNIPVTEVSEYIATRVNTTKKDIQDLT